MRVEENNPNKRFQKRNALFRISNKLHVEKRSFF
jgi:hypothetical protein